MNASLESQESVAATPPTSDDEAFINSLLGDEPVNALNSTPETEKPTVDDGAEKQKQTAKPVSIQEVAEKLGLKVEEVYALEVPLAGDGSKVTIGQLKDSIDELKTFEVKRLQFEEEKVQFEAGATRAKDELSAIVTKLKGVIPQQHFETLIEAGRAEYANRMNQEKAKVFEYIPEWTNKDTLVKEVSEINEFLEPYFGKDAFKQFNNAKMIKLIRDATKREQRIKAAIAKMTELTPTPKSNSRKAPVKTEQPRRMAGSKVDSRREFIDSLFK